MASQPKSNENALPCVDCCLIAAANDKENMLTPSFSIATNCFEGCLDTNDAMLDFVESLGSIVANPDVNSKNVNKKMQCFELNLKKIITFCQTIPDLFARFYELILEDMNKYTHKHNNKTVIILYPLIRDRVDADIKSFETMFRENRTPKRRIMKFLLETGDINAFTVMLQTLFSFHAYGMDLALVLPPKMRFIIESFTEVDYAMSDDCNFNTLYLHKSMCIIAKQVLDAVLIEGNIDVVELEKKVDKTSGPGLQFGLSELLLFYNKQEHSLHHFCYSARENDETVRIYCERLPIAEETKVLNNEYEIHSFEWIFHIKKEPFKQFLQKALLISRSEVSDNATVDVTSTNEVGKDDDVGDSMTCDNDCVDPSKDKKLISRKDIGENVSEDSNGDDDDTDPTKRMATVTSRFTVEIGNLFKYWDKSQNSDPTMKERRFVTTRVGTDWPHLYNSPCVVTIKYNHALKFESAKNRNAFAKVSGFCKICQSEHIFRIKRSPFKEFLGEKNKVKYIGVKDMIIDVSVTGLFHETDGKPDITKPVHKKENADGYHLKGEERQILADYATNKGVTSAFNDQFAFMNKDDMSKFNITSIRNRNVIKRAMYQSEKKMHGGETPYSAVKTVFLQQKTDFSPNFEKTSASMALPGNVRKFEEEPFKVYFANYDQLKVGAHYMNDPDKTTIINLDSSGKYWQDGTRAGKEALNSAIVIPPVSKGHSPFPIMETVSCSNKTIDFIQFLQYSWHLMSTAINNEKVANPAIAVSDFSFPNLHAFLNFFNKTDIYEYLRTAYNCFCKNLPLPYGTIITICKNHILPILLKTARAMHVDKAVADTFICGFLKVLEVGL